MKTLVFLLMMTLSATLFASNLEQDRFDHFEMIREMRQENSKKQQRVSERFVGRIRCANISHLKNQKCDLELLKEVKPEKRKNNINKRFEHLEGFDVGINL